MPQKPEIQYVGQFYVYGSEAQKLQPEKRRKPRTRLPLEKLEQMDQICVDPVAILGIAVAIFMLIVMAVGLLQIHDDWTEYKSLNRYVSRLNCRNEALTQEYRASFDLADIESKALGQGMIPKNEAQGVVIYVTLPEKAPETTWWEEVRWFWAGLFA